MRRRASVLSSVLAMAAMGLVISVPAFGAGFSIFEQGSRAMGMAGAFTAQADDPSAMFHNAAGLAFQEERDFLVGFTWIRSTEAEFEGDPPFPGSGVGAEQETLSEFPPHLYWVEPLGDRATFGLAINSPFGLVVEWEDGATFPGRFQSSKSALVTVDVNPTLAFKLSENFSLGVGAIARFAEVELNQFVGAQNPFTQTVDNVGFLDLTSDFNEGFGFNLGALHKVTNSFSWGLSYRSEVEVDFDGDGFLTQIPTGNPQLDGLIGQSLPFGRDLPVETGIDFPEMASLGLAFHLSPTVVLETDFNWVGWSSFDVLVIDFVNDDLPDAERPQNWDDVNNYRVGLSIDTAAGNQWRFGAVYDETPQPEEAVSPLLPDNDRLGATIGYGFQGRRVHWDFAFMYLHLDERTRDRSFPGEPDFFGTYDNEAILVGLSLGF